MPLAFDLNHIFEQFSAEIARNVASNFVTLDTSTVDVQMLVTATESTFDPPSSLTADKSKLTIFRQGVAKVSPITNFIVRFFGSPGYLY